MMALEECQLHRVKVTGRGDQISHILRYVLMIRNNSTIMTTSWIDFSTRMTKCSDFMEIAGKTTENRRYKETIRQGHPACSSFKGLNCTFHVFISKGCLHLCTHEPSKEPWQKLEMNDILSKMEELFKIIAKLQVFELLLKRKLSMDS